MGWCCHEQGKIKDDESCFQSFDDGRRTDRDALVEIDDVGVGRANASGEDGLVVEAGSFMPWIR
jgi:hypothetical protein